MIFPVTVNTFKRLILDELNPIFVLFTTPSAPQSVRLESLMALVESSECRISKCDVEAEYPLSVKYSIRVVPSIWLFDKGSMVTTKTGSQIQKMEDLKEMLNELK